jgi:hypothetical protein
MASLLLLGSLLTFGCCCCSGQLLTRWNGLLYALLQKCCLHSHVCLRVHVKLLLLLVVLFLCVCIHKLHLGLACILVRLEGLCGSCPCLLLLAPLLPCSPGPAAAAAAL